MKPVQQEQSRFFDGAAGPGSEMRIALDRAFVDGDESWTMTRQIGYLDRHFDQPFVVPNPAVPFATDLTSVPQIFTWLVPKTGSHLPAALVHDGLIRSKSEIAGGIYTHVGPRVTPVQADRVFRDAMADLGTPLIRRWLIWAAVSLASVATVKPRLLAIYMYLSLAAVGVLGYLATLDIFDQIEVLPWMGDRVWWKELIGGLLGALIIPALLSLPWALARLFKAGLIAGWALALLFHVTLAVAGISAIYVVAEYRTTLLDHLERKVKVPVLIGAVAGVAAITALTIWLCTRS